MTISRDGKIAFDKIQQPFLIKKKKQNSKLRMEAFLT